MEIKEKNDNLPTASLEDLELTNQQAEDAKGAGTPNGRLYVATNVGVYD